MTLTRTYTRKTRLPVHLSEDDLQVQLTEPSLGTRHIHGNQNFSVVVSAGAVQGHQVVYFLHGRLICARVSDINDQGQYDYDGGKRVVTCLRTETRTEEGRKRRKAHFLSLLE